MKRTMTTAEYLRYKDLEQYLFTDVNRRFRRDHSLDAFDLFSIVIWKANRAKSQVARRLRGKATRQSLDTVARQLTSRLYKCRDNKQRLITLRCDRKLGLPMATAILSVCYPDRFSIYDERVREELGDFESLSNITKPDKLWPEYERCLKAVRKAAPKGLSLRNCDRYLWARVGVERLKKDIRSGFRKRK